MQLSRGHSHPKREPWSSPPPFRAVLAWGKGTRHLWSPLAEQSQSRAAPKRDCDLGHCQPSQQLGKWAPPPWMGIWVVYCGVRATFCVQPDWTLGTYLFGLLVWFKGTGQKLTTSAKTVDSTKKRNLLCTFGGKHCPSCYLLGSLTVFLRKEPSEVAPTNWLKPIMNILFQLKLLIIVQESRNQDFLLASLFQMKSLGSYQLATDR